MSMAPVFLFAFANDMHQSLRLDEEWRNVEKALQHQEDEGNLIFNLNPITKREDIWDKFNRFHNRISIFHFGGHSNSEGFSLSDAKLKSDSLASLLGQEQVLKLAFLNGCNNSKQVHELFKQGVPAVIATSVAINDNRAINFSIQFYKGLSSGRTIKESFDTASNYVNNTEGHEVFVQKRGFELEDDSGKFAWGLYVNDESVLNWKIPEKKDQISSNKNTTTSFSTQNNQKPKSLTSQTYHLKARFLPSVISSIPAIVLLFYILSPLYSDYLLKIHSFFPLIFNLAISVALIFLGIQINRFLSKEIFQGLFFKEESHMPTTEYLLWGNKRLSTDTKRRLRKKIKEVFGISLPSKNKELEDELESRKSIITAVSQIRNQLRGNKLLLQHNTEYGAVRNFIGGSLVAFSTSLIIVAISLFQNNESLLAAASVMAVLYLIPLLLSKWFIQRFGNYYAKVLYEQFLTINSLP